MRVGGIVPLALALGAAPLIGCIEQQPPAYYQGYPPQWAPPAPAMGAYPNGFAPGAPAPGAAMAVAFARSRVGAPYCWGGTGPGCYDCSGLTREAWLAGGKAIPRTSTLQAARLPAVPLEWAQPGDILWRPGHVALYIGGGWVVSAPGTGQVVKYASAAGYVRALRP